MNKPTNPPDGQIMHAAITVDETRGELFIDCYRSKVAVSMCGIKDEDIVQVTVRAAKEGEETPYWGWWDYEENRYTMIWPSKDQSNICFMYGPKASEEAGKGKQLQLILELRG